MKFFFDLIVWSEFAKSHAMRACVFHVPTCQKLANFSFLRADVPTC